MSIMGAYFSTCRGFFCLGTRETSEVDSRRLRSKHIHCFEVCHRDRVLVWQAVSRYESRVCTYASKERNAGNRSDPNCTSLHILSSDAPLFRSSAIPLQYTLQSRVAQSSLTTSPLSIKSAKNHSSQYKYSLLCRSSGSHCSIFLMKAIKCF